MNIPILYQDDSIVLVNKPPGLPSQPTLDKNRPDLFTLLKKQFNGKLFLHHRLDRDTSGVILFAKDPRANQPLTEMFRQHKFTKIYLCLSKLRASDSHPPESSASSSPWRSGRWTIQNHLIARRKSGGGQKSVKMFRTDSGGDFAETHFELLSHQNGSFWIKASPVTGRTHQIRVHCLHSGLPILGDTLYGGKDSSAPRLMLHASELEFPHPLSQSILRIQAPLPEDMSTLLKKWHPLWQASADA